MQLQIIEIARIVEDPDQPRRALDEASLIGLADSIKQYGVLNPITVAPLGGVDGYRIVTGERRWRASQIAGLTEMPCIVRNEAHEDTAHKTSEQLIENVQREELTPLDKAKAIRSLKENLDANNREVAQRLGMSERTVGYLLDLLTLPESIGEQIVSSPNRPADGNLTEKHGRFLRQLNDQPEVQTQLADKIKGEKLSADDTGKIAKALRSHPDKQAEILASTIDSLASVVDISGDTDGPPPFSSGRAFVQILERVLPQVAEVRVSSVSASEIADVEAAASRVKEAVDTLVAQLRAAARNHE